jgi:hypothetical protein
MRRYIREGSLFRDNSGGKLTSRARRAASHVVGIIPEAG